VRQTPITRYKHVAYDYKDVKWIQKPTLTVADHTKVVGCRWDASDVNAAIASLTTNINAVLKDLAVIPIWYTGRGNPHGGMIEVFVSYGCIGS